MNIKFDFCVCFLLDLSLFERRDSFFSSHVNRNCVGNETKRSGMAFESSFANDLEVPLSLLQSSAGFKHTANSILFRIMAIF